jgi:hypothetical protein
VSVLTFGWAALATIALLWPGFGTSNPDSSLPTGFAGQRLQFELSQIIPLVVLFAVGVLFYYLGSNTRSHLVERTIPIGAEPELGVAVA